MTETLTRLPGSPGCFICDNNDSNPRALRLRPMWNEADRTVEIAFTPDHSWCGYHQVVHGGLVAAVLDEGMAWAVKATCGEWAFTADCHLRYKKPLEPGRRYLARAWVEEAGRKITARAQATDDNGGLVAQAEAVFIPAGGRARPRTVEESTG